MSIQSIANTAINADFIPSPRSPLCPPGPANPAARAVGEVSPWLPGGWAVPPDLILWTWLFRGAGLSSASERPDGVRRCFPRSGPGCFFGNKTTAAPESWGRWGKASGPPPHGDVTAPPVTHSCPGRGPALTAACGLKPAASPSLPPADRGATGTAAGSALLRRGLASARLRHLWPDIPEGSASRPRGFEDETVSHGPRRWQSSRFPPEPAVCPGGGRGRAQGGGCPRGSRGDAGPGRTCRRTPRPVHLRMPAAHAPDWPSPGHVAAAVP